MYKRSLAPLVQEFCFTSGKMGFISGPRQCGKTTLGRLLMGERNTAGYFNWDDIEFRRLWAKNPKGIVPSQTEGKPLVVLDEIHKAAHWKRSLKGVFDTLEVSLDILVTGSARLNVYRKGGDSLMGRYFHLRLHPFTLRELMDPSPRSPEVALRALFEGTISRNRGEVEHYENLKRFGGFPEPLFAQSEKRARLWRKSRTEQVIREDLRDLSRIPELSRIEMLAALLPERVGAPLSVAGLRETLDVSFDSVRRWLTALNDLYYLFDVPPYHRSLARAIKRDRKVYLWDYGEVNEPAARFENLVAAHLLKACHYWTDSGEGDFRLNYLRDKEGREIDFLITKDAKPWLAVECKLSDATPSPHWRRFLPAIGCRNAIQIIDAETPVRRYKEGDFSLLVAPAAAVLGKLV